MSACGARDKPPVKWNLERCGLSKMLVAGKKQISQLLVATRAVRSRKLWPDA